MGNFIRVMETRKKQPHGNARNERDIISQINSLHKLSCWLNSRGNWTSDNVWAAAAAAAKSLQSCPTLCDPINSSPPGSPVPGILQARTQEWVAISFSNAWKWKVKGKSLSLVRHLATPWTVAYQTSPSMGFSRKSTGVGCHCLLRTFGLLSNNSTYM